MMRLMWREVTVERVLLAIVLVFQLGGFWQERESRTVALAMEVGRVDQTLRTYVADSRETYMRRDVVTTELREIQRRLERIEARLNGGS